MDSRPDQFVLPGVGDYDELMLRRGLQQVVVHDRSDSIFAYLDPSGIPALLVLGLPDYKKEHGCR